MKRLNRLLTLFIFVFPLVFAQAQETEHSVAREWNELCLEAIRGDFARPTVHARNLFHSSAAMYDAWAAYEASATPYYLGNTIKGFEIPFEGVPIPDDKVAAQEEAISYAAYRLLSYRFQDSPQAFISQQRFNFLMSQLGYDINITSTNYLDGTPAHLGNYIAEKIIEFGQQDGSNEANEYGNQYYEPINPPLVMDDPGNPDIIDPNRWQPLSLTTFVDQSGNPLTENPPFLSPEWGNVAGFALADSVQTTYSRDDNDYHVFHDPGEPPFLDTMVASDLENPYKYGFAVVVTWSAHLDPSDGVMWDISPASIGNNPELPDDYEDFPSFYNIFNGGDASAGHDINPYTGEPYEPQMVPRGDYARVLAEFWADGPDSETPPGHWFTILNYVNEQPQLEKKWKGEGPVLSDLEWDVKTYFVLGGAMHDCAISAWSVKGWYDYIRPVSAIRYMAEQGQSSSQNLPSYDPNGIPLIPGFIELVDEDDPLAGDNDEHVGKIKFRSWRGPDYIDNPFSDVAGVGWILAENWWPYQRPTFVTPPFAGFVSGHSTFSRGAAEVLTLMTGDPYFPGGMGEFEAPANEFLVFEDGPSVDLTLQWATYRDASDQSSLSRIWGGIHPPADDIPGRKIGIEAGVNAFNYAETFINNRTPQISNVEVSDAILNSDDNGNTFDLTITYDTPMDTQIDPQVSFPMDDPTVNSLMLTQNQWLNDTTYFLSYDFVDAEENLPSIVLRIGGAFDQEGKVQQTFAQQGVFTVDSENPAILDAALSTSLIADAEAGNPFSIIVTFDESMDITVDPVIVLEAPTDLSGTLLTDELNSLWLDATTYQLSFFTFDANEEISDIGINIQSARDSLGNLQQGFELANVLTIDTKQPAVVEVAVNNELLNESNVGSEAVAFSLTFSEKMNQNILPDLIFPNENPLINSLDINTDASMWLSDTQYLLVYDLVDADEEFAQIDLLPAQAVDLAGNLMTPEFQIGIFSIDTRKPMVSEVIPSNAVFNDPLVGPATVYFNLTFDEQMNIEGTPELSFPDEDPSASIQFNESGSQWLTPFTFRAAFDLDDQNIELEDIDLAFAGLQDAAGNPFIAFTAHDVFDIDTRNPNILAFTANTYELMADNIGDDGFSMLIVTDEEMDVNTTPLISFPNEMPTILEFNEANSLWVNATTYQAYFNVAPMVEELLDIDVSLEQLFDSNGNPVEAADYPDYFDISIPVNTQDIPMVFQGLKIYPNPAKAGSLVRLEFAQAPQNLQWRLFDTQGKLVQENAAQINQQQYNLPTAELSNGVYFLQLISAEGSFTARLSIVR